MRTIEKLTADNAYSTESEQAKVRIILCSIIMLYTLGCYYFDLLSIKIFIIYFISIFLSVGILVWSKFGRRNHHPRRFLVMLADIGVTTLVMSLSGEAATPLFLIYLWTTFGNGFRYGKAYLYSCMSFSLIGFSAVLFFSPYWSEQRFLGFGLLITLSALPLYIAPLLERLQAAIELAQKASKEKSQFLASMSHEIRTPLNGVVGMSDLLSSTRMSMEQKEFINTIQSSAKTLLALIENILDISKIEAGKTELENVDFDLHELLTHITKMLFPSAEAKGLECKLHIAADVPYLLKGDSIHLRQILINLIGNASKFTHEGSITVKLSKVSQSDNPVKLRFEIIDTGIGISDKEQGEIFETFTQADQSINRKFGGTGLGTAISKKLVNLMNGQIGVISELDEGSTFWFELEYSRQNQPIEITDNDEIISNNPKVLLIATTGSRHDSLVAHLQDWQFKWDHANDKEDAFALLQKAEKTGRAYDVALIDHQSLGDNISVFTQQFFLHPLSKKTNMVLITQKGLNLNSQNELLSSGFFCILESPVEKRLLFNALHATSLDHDNNSNVTRLVQFNPESNPASLNILVGEDNRTNQKVIHTILEYAGHHADIVSNGNEVLDAIEVKKYDMIILDMHMPEMDGIEAAKALRFLQTGNESIPILMLTADATAEAIRASEDAGIDVYLTKPIESEKLLNTIASLSPKKRKTQSAPSLAHTQTLDYESLDKIASLSKSVDFMQNLINGFFADTDELIEQINIAIEEKNYADVQDHAHAIKGSARSIGAISLAQCAVKIQEKVQAGSFIGLPSLSDSLSKDFESTKTALTKYLEKLNSLVL